MNKPKRPDHPKPTLYPKMKPVVQDPLWLGKDMTSHQGYYWRGIDQRYHTFIAGATGKGKSYLLYEMIINRAKTGSAIFLDPHGTLCDTLKEYFATKADYLTRQRMIYLDINDINIIGYNPLAKRPYLTLDKQTSLIMEAFLRASDELNYSDKPRLERWFQLGWRTLIETESTMLDAVHIFALQHNARRDEIIRKAQRIGIFGDEQWDIVRNIKSERLVWEQFESSFNRVMRVLNSGQARLILNQPKENSIDLMEIMNERKILLVNLSPQKVGKFSSRMIGLLLLSEIFELSYLKKPYHPDTNVFVDELDRLVTPSIIEGLSETRKYNVFWTMATQYLNVLGKKDSKELASVLTNCRNKIAFGGMTYDDCALLDKELFAGEHSLEEVKLTGRGFEPQLIKKRETSVDHIEEMSNSKKTDQRTDQIIKAGAVFPISATGIMIAVHQPRKTSRV